MHFLNRCLLVLLATCHVTAWAAVFTVDTGSDAVLSDCLQPTPADCSLRGAILAANAMPDADRIEFDIPDTDASYQAGTAHWRIDVSTALPNIEQTVEIDGYTQPGAVENTLAPDQGGSNAVLKIELQNASVNPLDGLSSGNNFVALIVIRGLAIHHFTNQIAFYSSASNRVEGCFLGTDISGSVAANTGNNPGNGLRLLGAGDYVIGGTNPAARNVISGLNYGMFSFQTLDGTRIEGNLIGSDASGTASIGNRSTGINFGNARNVIIGGADVAARNLFVGNALGAIYLSGSDSPSVFPGTKILGNRFGTDVSGTLNLGNGLNPTSPSQPLPTISLFAGNPCAVQIGGDLPGEANHIANSGAAGVLVGVCAETRMLRNTFARNRGLPIDLSVSSNPDGATANDSNDADSGGNRLQNTPVIVGVGTIDTNTVEVDVLVDSAAANASYPIRVDFYRGDNFQAAEWLQTLSIPLAQAQLPQTVVLPLSAFDDQLLVMTATDANGNTSEFGAFGIGDVFADGFED